MKKNILIIILVGFILSSFYDPGEYAGTFYCYLNQKNRPEQGIHLHLDSIKASLDLDLTSSDLVQIMKEQPGAIKPIKCVLIVTGNQGRKVIPYSSPKSMIMYDYTGEELEETAAFIKKTIKFNPKDTIKTEVVQPAKFLGGDMMYHIVRNQ